MSAERRFDDWENDDFGGRGRFFNLQAREYNGLLDRFESKYGLAERYLRRVDRVIGNNILRRVASNMISGKKISAADAVMSDAKI